MDLKQIVPWGRDFQEYSDMFSLSSLVPDDSVLGCGDGPASFNVESMAKGIRVTSVDPLYGFSKVDIARRIDEARDEIMPQVRAKVDSYIWRSMINPDELESRRMQAMHRFLNDFEFGYKQRRYIAGQLPTLPFPDNAFNYALCSHLLFLYSPQMDEQQHLKSVLELCRVSREVRIYPLVSIDNNERSKHLPAVLSALRRSGYHYEEVPVSYEFLPGATAMLKITT